MWLDWRLNWRVYKAKVAEKLKTQDYILSRIAAKTWGPGLIRAREVYTKCIRSAIVYRATNYYIPTTTGGQLQGLAKRLAKAQSRSLRIIAGAYKATPIRNLETETWVPPLDLYLNKRLADLKARLQEPSLQTGQGQEAPAQPPQAIIQEACNKIFRRFQRCRPGRKPTHPQLPTATERAAITTQQWVRQNQTRNQRLTEEETALYKACESRWRQQIAGRPTRIADESTPDQLFTNRVLNRYKGLTKA